MQYRFRVLLTSVCSIIIAFIALSIFALLLTRLFPQLYSETLFVISFAIGGILASAAGFEFGMETSEYKTTGDRWSLIILQVLVGLGSFFFLSRIQHYEFQIPFKSFGLALAFGSILHAGDKTRDSLY